MHTNFHASPVVCEHAAAACPAAPFGAARIVPVTAYGVAVVYLAALLGGVEAVPRSISSLPGEQRCGSAGLVTPLPMAARGVGLTLHFCAQR